MFGLGPVCAVHAAPTVNGLFYGDGDVDEYAFLQNDTTGGSRGKLYVAQEGSTVYLALVVDETVNDNVCGTKSGQPPNDSDYMASANWSAVHTCERLIGSDHLEIGVQCGPDYDWFQDLVYAADGADDSADPRNETWLSDENGPDGSITALPPDLTSASSTQWNLNNTTWDMTLGGSRTSSTEWKSPDRGTVGDVTDDGWPKPPDADGFATNSNGDVDWEWPLVYEMSFDASNCTGPLTVNPGSSHNSPAKDDEQDMPFDPVVLTDYGDAPDSYGTLTASNGPSHPLLFDSQLGLGATQSSENDGQPTDDATGDGDEEDGVSAFPTGVFEPGDSYTVSVEATNTTGASAELCGWVDFDLDGGEDDGSFDQDERACVTVPADTADDDSTAECADESDGLFTCDVTFTIPDDFVFVEDEPTFSRFRIASDSTEVQSPQGAASDGEVEDYLVPASSMPVSLSSFQSRVFGNVLDVEWTTASETFNVGFDVWGKLDGEWQRLTAEPILSKASDAVTPQDYDARIPLRNINPRAIESLALSSIERTGEHELYGEFEVGESYGDKTLPEAIPWNAVRAERNETMRAKGYEKRGGKWRKKPSGKGKANARSASHAVMELRITEPGMQRVTYEQLKSRGMDLAGVRPNAIAVTLKGEGVTRRVEAGPGNGLFGPGGHIDFWGLEPDFPDALYVSDYVYRVEVDQEQAKRPEVVKRRARSGASWALEPRRVNEDSAYLFVNATEDPWHARMLIHPWGPTQYTANVNVDAALKPGRPGRVEAVMTALSDFAKIDPDHRIRLSVNGTTIVERDVSGHRAVTLSGEVPASVLAAGANTVSVELPGGTEAPFDTVTVDRVALWYPRTLQADNDRLHVESEIDAPGLRGSGFSRERLVAYARQDTGRLHELRVDARRSGDSWDAFVPTVRDEPEQGHAEYWVSSPARLNQPELMGTVERPDLLEEPADYLLIAHPSFMPSADDEAHPLNRYMAHRESQGWNVRAVGIDAIQNVYGGGMPLPGAVTKFLAAADDAFDYSHVLLVGDDSYDYLDKLGLGSVSFIPTMYADTNVIHHSPSDGLMTDLDGDNLSDKAVGRWPVRSLTDLEVMVRKTLDWEDTTDGPRDARTSVWVTDSEDPDVPSFRDQAERMIATLRTPLAGDASEPWPDENISRVYFDEVTPAAGQRASGAARDRLMQALASGQTITGFAGHGSPTAWTFQGLLAPKHVSEMRNEGRPTLVATLTCYTTYFVSPHTNTLAHRLMAGYRLDEQGKQIDGVANGAVAVHGAATLSGYSDNEQLARTAMEQQINEGDTLGEAIRHARWAAAQAGHPDTAVNWTLLGDPTLTIEP